MTDLSNNCVSSVNNNHNNNNHSNSSNNNNNFDRKVTIQEIGQETLEREMSRERQQKLESPKKVEEKFENSESSKHIKVQIEPQQFVEISTKPKTFSNKMKLDEKSSNFDQKGSTKKVESPNVSVRHVPIRLDDGKIIQRDPDETMEIRLG